MEHEVFVPLPVTVLRRTLGDPARVARALPGFQKEAGAEPVSGRLKLRVGSTTVTYRGRMRLTAGDDGTYTAEGAADEARGTGRLDFTLTVRLAEASGGTTLTFSGKGTADGRTAELPSSGVESALRRLLGRFADNLAVTQAAPAGEPQLPPDGAESAAATHAGQAADRTPLPAAEPATGNPQADRKGGDSRANGSSALHPERYEDEPPVRPEKQDPDHPDGVPLPPGSSLFGTEVPPSSLAREDDDAGAGGGTGHAAGAADSAAAADDTVTETGHGAAASGKRRPADADADADDADAPDQSVPATTGEPDPRDSEPRGVDPLDAPDGVEPPAEAAHARRTMIGRSAEEVDHAPPRGRYAPAPAAESFASAATLRWAAPAAALVVAAAVVAGRALRRRG